MSAEHPESGRRPERLSLWALLLQARRSALADAIGVWAERRQTRRHMARLSDHMLNDIGLARTDVDREVAKAFWRK
jgi:uncharacterized protein YjiS (DUF1127 family)